MKKTKDYKESLTLTEEARQDDNGEGVWFTINDIDKAAHDENIFGVIDDKTTNTKDKKL